MSDVKRYKPFIELAGDGPVATMWDTALNSDASEYPEYVLASDYDALASRLAEAERDAARYRWLRINPDWESEAALSGMTPEDFDMAVDSAIRAANKNPAKVCHHTLWKSLCPECGAAAALSPRHQSAEGAEGEGT